MDPRGNQVRTSSASLASAADYDDTHQLLSLPLVSSVTEMPNVEFLESARFALTYITTYTTHSSFFDRLVPSGTYKVQEMLQQGGWGCAEGGFTGTFTPMMLMVARKPGNRGY